MMQNDFIYEMKVINFIKSVAQEKEILFILCAIIGFFSLIGLLLKIKISAFVIILSIPLLTYLFVKLKLEHRIISIYYLISTILLLSTTALVLYRKDQFNVYLDEMFFKGHVVTFQDEIEDDNGRILVRPGYRFVPENKKDETKVFWLEIGFGFIVVTSAVITCRTLYKREIA